jgi:hypothetical protein
MNHVIKIDLTDAVGETLSALLCPLVEERMRHQGRVCLEAAADIAERVARELNGRASETSPDECCRLIAARIRSLRIEGEPNGCQFESAAAGIRPVLQATGCEC